MGPDPSSKPDVKISGAADPSSKPDVKISGEVPLNPSNI
jgi:hypothetical protein